MCCDTRSPPAPLAVEPWCGPEPRGAASHPAEREATLPKMGCGQKSWFLSHPFLLLTWRNGVKWLEKEVLSLF